MKRESIMTAERSTLDTLYALFCRYTELNPDRDIDTITLYNKGGAGMIRDMCGITVLSWKNAEEGVRKLENLIDSEEEASKLNAILQDEQVMLVSAGDNYLCLDPSLRAFLLKAIEDYQQQKKEGL